ncbi:hypothetical protein M011DRAFT_316426 [Sporormia fimetaria CBS 119925]|uniref:Uncharacterized protein n=1 Tax=Sporormia fimetaria CBS 119925 TaxID=1340428 RepID=A0A6A6UU15_9PLEO|nr:hypothetical protein M011DRAFT_316426 [Sporormia fimetaria CBS 119925]
MTDTTNTKSAHETMLVSASCPRRRGFSLGTLSWRVSIEAHQQRHSRGCTGVMTAPGGVYTIRQPLIGLHGRCLFGLSDPVYVASVEDSRRRGACVRSHLPVTSLLQSSPRRSARIPTYWNPNHSRRNIPFFRTSASGSLMYRYLGNTAMRSCGIFWATSLHAQWTMAFWTCYILQRNQEQV